MAEKPAKIDPLTPSEEGTTITGPTHVLGITSGADRLSDQAADFLPPPEPNRVPPLLLPDGKPPAAAQTSKLPPPTIPGYEILGELGHGGMGVVYRAKQISLNRIVALKMIRSGDLASPQDLARFRSEAEAVARLKHPNIVHIYEVGERDGRPFFSLEYVEGGSLSHQVKGIPQPPRLAAELAETLARAVHAAHQRSIIHRDLKPANVLLQIADCRLQIEKQEGSAPAKSAILNLQSAIPKITDFGLAKRLDLEATQTQTGAVMGTPSYMAPEQAAGKSKEIGPGVDIYSLGAILYELLTGRPPFLADSWEATRQLVVSEEPVLPRRLQPKLPRDLQTICMKCLDKEPGRRYASAEVLADDLKRWRLGEPILARPQTLIRRGWRLLRRHPMKTAALLMLILTMTVLTVSYYQAPAQQLERIERRLESGQPVELIGETGKPAWFRWITDEINGKAGLAADGTFLVQHSEFGLVELVPDPKLSRYRFRAEVRHEQGKTDDRSEVGIYFAYMEVVTRDGAPRHCYCRVAFNDLEDTNQNQPKRQQKGNPLTLFVKCHPRGGDIWDERRIGSPFWFQLNSRLNSPKGWRKLAVDVAPEQIVLFWEGQRIGEYPRRTLANEANEMLRKSLNPIVGDAKFEPQQPLGLYVYRGTAAFRFIAVEPLDEQ